MRPYIAQIRSNLRLMGRDRTVLFFSYLFPLTFFFIFAQSFHVAQSPSAMTQVIAMVLIIGVLGNGFFGAGMRAVQDRETNVLRRFKVAPVSAAPIIVASMVSGFVAYLPTIFLFFFFGTLMYHMPLPHNLLSVVIFICLGVLAFRSMGMIIAAVVNSAQEAGILIQILYLPMLFLSGATFPVSMMPDWLRIIAQFLPATYLYQGVESIMIGGRSLFDNWPSVLALIIAALVALIVGTKIFRWEKEEKISRSAKLWVLGVLAPFLLMGLYQAHSRQSLTESKILARRADRDRSVLFQNAKIFIGDGAVIPNGAVLIKNGKIAQVFSTPPTDTKRFQAEVIDASGKTLIPGLIDMHVHIGSPGGVYQDTAKYGDVSLQRRRLAAYLYSGITAVRSTGDWLDQSLKLRAEINSGEYLGAEFFTCGPLFTAPGGHPTEMIRNLPGQMHNAAEAQFLRLPKSPTEARSQVDALKQSGVDCIKAVLESGSAEWQLFNHLDLEIYRAIIAEAASVNLPSATHTGSVADVKEAIDVGSRSSGTQSAGMSIEHGSMNGPIPPELFAAIKQKGIAYDPTLSMFEESVVDWRTGNAEPLNRPLILQVGPSDLLADTRAALAKQHAVSPDVFKTYLADVNKNLLNAYRAGVLLIAGSDAGNMLEIHGPTVQHELELWAKAGIPPAAALQAATYNAAKVLRAENRIGSIRPGHDATLVLLDGDPLSNIADTERVSLVMFRGEIISRTELFHQESQ